MSWLQIFFKKSSRALEPLIDFSFLQVDMHNHVLPGIDDGAPSLADAKLLYNGIIELGFSEIIPTPHIYPSVHENDANSIQTAHNKAQLGNTFFGAEYMINADFNTHQSNFVSLPNQHLLVEFPYVYEPLGVKQILFNLQLQGFKVILAHPERYIYYHQKPSLLQSFFDAGILFQANLLAFQGYYGRQVQQAAEYLLDKKMYSFAGTDAHHEGHLKALTAMQRNCKTMQILQRYPFKNNTAFTPTTLAHTPQTSPQKMAL
ncbi:MAG: histidinol phosphatase [Bacteroidetes bacterium]|nr:MAG: histidinol phosphatase [Bacteroidota bacterium]TAE63811.1 MAG: histidinol phosphatase [Bacteroidota bacterium]TAF93372.1 MAG: histidinol phosphatase [Bacteroidota bacterium]